MRKVYAGSIELPDCMARDPSVLDDESSVSTDAEATDEGGNKKLLHRRSYMKLAGATTAAATLTGAASAVEDDYEVVEARGQTVTVNRGETYENKLIDLTTGESFLIMVEGADSAVRNIGFKGLYRGDSFMISINAGQGDILFENIYLGDGATKEGASFVHGPGAVFMHRGSEADLTFRNCNVQGYPNNGFYCSNTPYGGSVRFERCFGKNNGVTTFRCGSEDDEIIDCVAYNDDTDYGRGYGGYGETNGRPVWVWNGGTVTIRDSHFADGPYPYSLVAGANGSAGSVDFQSGGYRGQIREANGSTVSIGNDVSREPDLSIPDGVPTSPEAAASAPNPPARAAEPTTRRRAMRRARNSRTSSWSTAIRRTRPDTSSRSTVRSNTPTTRVPRSTTRTPSTARPCRRRAWPTGRTPSGSTATSPNSPSTAPERYSSTARRSIRPTSGNSFHTSSRSRDRGRRRATRSRLTDRSNSRRTRSRKRTRRRSRGRRFRVRSPTKPSLSGSRVR